MRASTKVILAVIALATSALQAPAVQAALGAFLMKHPSTAAIEAGVVALVAVLHEPAK